MIDTVDSTKVLNARILFLTVVVTIATVFSLGVAVLALPSDKILLGIAAEVIFVITIPIIYYLTKPMLK